MTRTVYKLLEIPVSKPVQMPGVPIDEVIYKNKKHVVRKTHKDSKKERLETYVLPRGMKIFSIDEFTDVTKVLRSMFSEFTNTKYSTDYQENVTIFATETHNKMVRLRNYTVQEVLDLLKTEEMKNLVKYYFKKIIKKLNLSETVINEATFSILRYRNSKSELHCHVDNLNHGRGPIVTVNIGPKIYYDMIPIYYLKNDHYPMRIRVHNNEAVILDGESRYCWAHCIPYGYPKASEKFTLKFLFPKVLPKNRFYSDFFEQEIK